MKIKQICVENLHGYINEKFLFKDDITFLIGINGGGKTSILNVIKWFLSGQIQRFCITKLDRVQLDIEINKKPIKFEATSKNGRLAISVCVDGLVLPNIIYKYFVDPESLTDESQRIEALERYIGMSPTKGEQKAWDYIHAEIQKPFVIGLDRTNSRTYSNANKRAEIQSINSRSELNRRSTSGTIDPIQTIKKDINQSFRMARHQQLVNLMSLNEKIIDSFFDIKKTKANKSINESSESLDAIETGFSRHFKKLESHHLVQKIEKYIEYMKTTPASPDKSEGINRLKSILRLFDNYARTSEETFKELNVLLGCVNSFLNDSSKEIKFDEQSAEVCFGILNKTVERDIDFLSSGERQILTLMTYVWSAAREGVPVIIDEPELSLHPEWQIKFLEQSIKAMNGRQTQIIIATHSPEVLGADNRYYIIGPKSVGA